MQTKFTILPMSTVDFSISHVKLDATSPLNHNESHIHKECEIYVNLTGDVSFEVENRIYPISRGSVIITRPYEYHHCIYRSNAQHDHFWITFSADERETFLEMFFDREKGTGNLILLEESQLQDCCRLLQTLLQKETDVLTRRICFLQFIQILSAGKGEKSIGIAENLPADVAAGLLYMDAHLTEDISIESLSQACSVSTNTLERHFKEALGVTPFAMLRKKRLVASLEHLRNGFSVTEAAFQSGFSDYSNYIQLFRKQFGITPLQYKKKFELR